MPGSLHHHQRPELLSSSWDLCYWPLPGTKPPWTLGPESKGQHPWEMWFMHSFHLAVCLTVHRLSWLTVSTPTSWFEKRMKKSVKVKSLSSTMYDALFFSLKASPLAGHKLHEAGLCVICCWCHMVKTVLGMQKMVSEHSGWRTSKGVVGSFVYKKATCPRYLSELLFVVMGRSEVWTPPRKQRFAHRQGTCPSSVS